MTELRWLISREQAKGTFSEPIDWPDGSTVFARLQYRPSGLAGDAPWQEIPTVTEIKEIPRIALVPKGAH